MGSRKPFMPEFKREAVGGTGGMGIYGTSGELNQMREV
jgi:hypothetical protein